MLSIYSHCINTLRSPLRVGGLVAFLLAGVSPVFAAQAQLAWDASPNPGVAGYIVHYGQSKDNFTAQIDVGKATAYTVSELAGGQTYYFVVTAYDAARVESGYSNEINRSVPESAAANEVITQSTNENTQPSTPSVTNTDSAPVGTTETGGASGSATAGNSGNDSSASGSGSNSSSGGGGGGCTITTGPADFSLPLLAGFSLLGLRLRANRRHHSLQRGEYSTGTT